MRRNTGAILALFEKVEVLILSLIAIDSGSPKSSGINLISQVLFRLVLICLGVILGYQLEEGIEMKLDYFYNTRVITVLV